MKTKTKKKILQWVCKQLKIPKPESYPLIKTICPPIETLGTQLSFDRQFLSAEAQQIEERALKHQLTLQLAEALLENNRSLITIEDNGMLRTIRVKIRVIPWMEEEHE